MAGTFLTHIQFALLRREEDGCEVAGAWLEITVVHLALRALWWCVRKCTMELILVTSYLPTVLFLGKHPLSIPSPLASYFPAVCSSLPCPTLLNAANVIQTYSSASPHAFSSQGEEEAGGV